MTLIKTSLLSLVASIFKIIFGFVVYKLIAVYAGPSGVALLGQFQSVQQGLSGVATGGFGQGLVKYLSEFKNNINQCQHIFSTAVKLVFLYLMPTSLLLYFFSESISLLVFDSPAYAGWLKFLAVALVPSSMGALFVAALNGLHEVHKLTLVGVISSVLGVVLAFACIPVWGVFGAIIALLGGLVVTTFLALWMLQQLPIFSLRWFQKELNKPDSHRLGKFILMALTSAISISVSHILIRNYLSDTISIDAAGLWTAMWRISAAYLLVISMTLSVYYLPRLSSLNIQYEIRREITHGQRLILPFVVFSSLIIFLMRDWIVLVLFDSRFLAMRDLFAYQLIGDVIKIAAFLYAYMMLAKAKTTVFIVAEIFFSLFFVLLVVLFVNNFGLVGVSYAFTANYLAYFVFVYFWFNISCKKSIFDGTDPQKINTH